MNKKGKHLFILSICLLIVIGILINLYMISNDNSLDEEIIIKNDGIYQDVLNVNYLTLVPSESKKYEVGIKAKMSGNYLISLKFNELEDGNLKEFVDAMITINGEVVYEGDLKLLLSGEIPQFETYLKQNEQVVMIITYTMPIEIGNEAKNTYSSFNIDFKIETN